VDINGTASPGASVSYIAWSWGDGTNDAGFFPRSHTYSSQGKRTVTVTAHYDDGSTASSSQTVTVAPGALSNCLSLTITAGANGSVFYQASVGSSTIPAGASVTLELDDADDLFLTATPGNCDSFSNWSASAGITATGGNPINTTSPSIDIVINSSGSRISANFNSSSGGSPTYQLDVSPTSATVPPSGSASFLIQVIPQNCFAGSVKLLSPIILSGGFSFSYQGGVATIQPGTPASLVISVAPTVVPGTYTIQIPTTTLSKYVNVIVSQPVIGVQNTINLTDYSIAEATSCFPGYSSCFSIQQNVEIGPPSATAPFSYWAQNIIVVQTNGSQANVLGVFQLFKSPNLTTPIECYPGVAPACGLSVFPGSQSFMVPVTWSMTTEIDSGGHLVMANSPYSLGNYTFQQLIPGGYINLGYNNSSITQSLIPELVVVGNSGGATSFLPATTGSVQSLLQTSNGWLATPTLSLRQKVDTLTTESSTGLQWTFSGSTASFGATGIQAEGIGFVPGTAVSNSTVGGGVGVDQISSTGVSVAITGSTASDGTPVTVATANEGAAQPPGTGQVSLESAGFYDVNVQGISDGTALVCISSSTVFSQTKGMQYWSSVGAGSWIAALNITVTTGTPNTICGDIPVAALKGTPIAIGPLLPSTPCATDVSTLVAVTRSGYTYNFATRRFYQTLTLTNSSSSTISVPIALALDSLSSNASLFNGSGVTACGSLRAASISSRLR
jgi:hypothetical protein